MAELYHKKHVAQKIDILERPLPNGIDSWILFAFYVVKVKLNLVIFCTNDPRVLNNTNRHCGCELTITVTLYTADFCILEVVC